MAMVVPTNRWGDVQYLDSRGVEASRSPLGAPNEVFETLRTRKHLQNSERLAAGEAWDKKGASCSRPRSARPPTPPGAEFDQVVKLQASNPSGQHSLRNTAASLLSDTGVRLEVVADGLPPLPPPRPPNRVRWIGVGRSVTAEDK